MEYLGFYTSKIDSFSGFSKPFNESRYVVLGVPYDHTSTYRAGSRFAPKAIREASLNIETYSLRTGIDIENVPIYDAGDLHVVDNAAETVDRLSKVTRELLSAGKMPVSVGGEHTITLGVVRSLPKNSGVISFDAHGDLRDEYGGGKLSHATVLRRITEEVGTDGVLICGVRALCKEEVDFIEQHRVQNMTPWDIREIGLEKATERVKAFANKFQQVYLTIDTDVLDPAFAPGIANPEFDGLNPQQLLTLATAVAGKKMIAFDLVEVCPHYDTGATAVAAARTIFEVIAANMKSRAG